MAYSSSFLQLGVLLDRRVLSFVLPVFFFIVLYSKLPHKVAHSIFFFFLLIKKAYMIPFHFMMQELRFIISSVPIFNLSAAIAATRMYVADV
jgi:alpha-1,6-mannosyltransferase